MSNLTTNPITDLTTTVADGGSNRRPSTLEPGASFTLTPLALEILAAKVRAKSEVDSEDYTWLDRERDQLFVKYHDEPLHYARKLVSAIQVSAKCDAKREMVLGGEFFAISKYALEVERILDKASYDGVQF